MCIAFSHQLPFKSQPSFYKKSTHRNARKAMQEKNLTLLTIEQTDVVQLF